MRERLRRVGVVRAAIFVVGTGTVVFLLFWDGSEQANRAASIIAVLLALMALLGLQPAPIDYQPIHEALPAIIEDVRKAWRDEAMRRGLYEIPLIPPKINVLRGLKPSTAAYQYLTAVPGVPSWSFSFYKERVAAVVSRFEITRGVLYGDGGSGKTTIAVAMTIGLLDRRSELGPGPGRLVPLTLSLSSWAPDREDFELWINRRLVQTYPALAVVDPRGKGGRARRLADSGEFIFILDSVDEVPRQTLNRAINTVNKFFPPDKPLVLLSRRMGRRLFGIKDAAHLALALPDTVAIERYLRETARATKKSAAFALLVRELRAYPNGTLARVLRIPLYTRLTCRAVLSGRIDASVLRDEAQAADGNEAVRGRLFAALIDETTASGGVLGAKRSRVWLTYLASELERRPSPSFAWWRLSEGVPSSVLFAASASVSFPAYLLALLMPVGLTRGLALGVCTGIGFGLLRGTRPKLLDVFVAALVIFGAVLLVSLSPYGDGLQQGLIDAIEISLSVSAALAIKERLLYLYSRMRATLSVCAIGLVVALITDVLSWMLNFDDPDRSLTSLIVACVLGVGIAVFAARTLIPSRRRMQPSMIQLSVAHRLGGLLPPMRAGIAAASLIGLAGAFGGAIRYGVDYGLALVLVFGLVVGLPVGIIGGLIRWLAAPVSTGTVATSKSTLRNDRIAAIGSIVGIGASATAAILLFSQFLRPVLDETPIGSSVTLIPLQGVLLGLTMGVVVACFYTAWPNYALSHLWLFLTGKLPWRLEGFLRELQAQEILRQEGPLYQFRNAQLQRFLAN